MNILISKDTIPLAIQKRDMILEQLRKKGFRITEQRKLLIEVILEDECSSCKEIYYKAVQKDASVGIATVYRMVKTLEDLDVINRKNLYLIDYDNLNLKNDQKILFIDEKSEQATEIKKGDWFKELQKALIEQGLHDIDNLSILIKNKNNSKEDDLDDRLHNSCSCDNTGCQYHCKKRSAS